MNELYELKEKLCKELKRYNNEDVTTGNLEIIDKLAHATKNLDKIIEKYEEDEGASYGYSNRGGRNSYGRGRGRNARRDSRGRYASEGSSYEGYSRNGDIVAELREMMMDAPDEQTRQEYQKVIQKLEMM